MITILTGDSKLKDIVSLDFLGYHQYSIGVDGTLYSHYVAKCVTDKKIGNKIIGKVVDKNSFKKVTPLREKDVFDNLQIRLSGPGGRRAVNIAFLVASAFIENPLGHKGVEYLDNNPLNLHVSNLKWVPDKYQKYNSMKFTNKDGSTCKVI